MSLSDLHPITAQWFDETFGVPTPAQRRGWAAIREQRHTLIAAPTGSGKTLAAFLIALDDLLKEGLAAPLADEVRVVYVSPLKALSADIHKNLAEPRRGIRRAAEAAGIDPPSMTAAVRTGDTPPNERAAMLRKPPHILVTTPESLYLLLTAERSRAMLRTVRTVIVDEIHAVIGGRRGAHLALSLERLQQAADAPIQRIGLSATQKPIDEVARFLVGTRSTASGADGDQRRPVLDTREGHGPSASGVGVHADQRRPVLDTRERHGSSASGVGVHTDQRRPVLDTRERYGSSASGLGMDDDQRRPVLDTREGHGSNASGVGVGPHAVIIDEGHRRAMDLGLELPQSPLEAVMSHEVWEEYYERLTALIVSHRTTLVFVNTRRLAERVARHLSDRVGSEAVTAHHGSLSKEKRLDAEMRLRNGTLKALVATASLELGIDIGHVDLVCQIGSPHRIATLLQRVGRSGHTVAGTPKGRVFPMSRDDLIECAALLRAIRLGELDRIVSHDAPLDVLTQQVVAEASCCEYAEDDLFALVRGAWPYRDLRRADFDAVIAMAADGFATKRGRRAALLHRDEVNAKVRGRRAARLLALTSGGAIPEVADYRVVLEPDDTFIGTLNEDFAIESMGGDVFQLGNLSWRVLQVGSGVVRVADAKGAPPNIPFWLGEAPGRSNELSAAVSDLRAQVERLLAGARPEGRAYNSNCESPEDVGPSFSSGARPDVVAWLTGESGVSAAAAEQAIAYLAEGRQALGVLPTQHTLVLERFFDESGGMQLVLHAPFGSRINKAWGLALRKRFCRQFNFELQAAATEEGLLLSLGPQHSFPLADVFRYLHPATARDVLVQAFLDAPVFQTRWRWNTTISLAVPRNRGGRKVPPQLQRMLADDLMAAVFPDLAACLENIPGDREIPDHPLVNQTVRDCLQEAMDFDGLAQVLASIHHGDLQLIARDTPEPSPLSHEILNARPYAFLDDAPLEERRAHAVYARRAGEPAVSELGALDPAAIERVRDEQRPQPRDADELHDALLTAGFLTSAEAATLPADLFDALAGAGRAAVAHVSGRATLSEQSSCRATLSGSPVDAALWIPAERVPELLAIHANAALQPRLTIPPSRAAKAWTRDQAIVELLRGRLTIAGPVTASALAADLGISPDEADTALLTLESEGVVLRGTFEKRGRVDFPAAAVDEKSTRPDFQWCDRALLARIHRYTLNRLRAEIEPVDVADFTRFLFSWHHADPDGRLSGIDGLRAILGLLDGFEAPAAAWERAILPARMDRYDPALLDLLSLTGEVGWARLSPASTAVGSATPIALFVREHSARWQALRRQQTASDAVLTEAAARVLAALEARGASFFKDLAAACGLDHDALQQAIAALVAAGLVTSDGFAGLRALFDARAKARAYSLGAGSIGTSRPDLQVGRGTGFGGRWSLVFPARRDDAFPEEAIDAQARALLRRYGVVFRRAIGRETNAAPWRLLARVFRRLEARGEIRGGRFVAGVSGEQFALPEAVDRLREVRRTPKDGRLSVISAADPLNLAGVLDAGDRVRTIAAHRIVYRDGIPLAALEGDYMRPLRDIDASIAGDVASALTGRRMPPVVSGYVGA